MTELDIADLHLLKEYAEDGCVLEHRPTGKRYVLTSYKHDQVAGYMITRSGGWVRQTRGTTKKLLLAAFPYWMPK